MTTAQVATELGLSVRHVRQLIASEELTGERQWTPRGFILWVRPADVRKFKRQRQAEAQAIEGRPKKPRGRPKKLPPSSPPPPDAP